MRIYVNETKTLENKIMKLHYGENLTAIVKAFLV